MTASTRELIDARGALLLAEQRFAITQRKWRQAMREYKPPSETFTFRDATIKRKPVRKPQP
jgi:hypothetical protein